jgi:hypothetical protein
MNVYPIILLSLNQALLCSASLSAHPVGSVDLSDRTRHRRAYRRPWWSCATLHSQSAINFLAGHQIHLKRKASYDKRGKGKNREKKKKMTIMLLGVRYSFQHPGASAKYSHVTITVETTTDFDILYWEPHVLSALSTLLLSKSVIVLYGKLTLAVEPELLKPGPQI